MHRPIDDLFTKEQQRECGMQQLCHRGMHVRQGDEERQRRRNITQSNRHTTESRGGGRSLRPVDSTVEGAEEGGEKRGGGKMDKKKGRVVTQY